MKKKYIFLALFFIFAAMQFIPVNRDTPSVPQEQDFLHIENPPEQIARILKDACYDCHSYETKYPWYARIAPLSWWIQGHINGGRQHLNYSEWTKYPVDEQQHKLKESAEEVEEKHMPLKSYTWLHSEAKLSDTDRNAFVEWANK